MRESSRPLQTNMSRTTNPKKYKATANFAKNVCKTGRNRDSYNKNKDDKNFKADTKQLLKLIENASSSSNQDNQHSNQDNQCSNPHSRQWEIEGATNNAALKNLKWKLTSDVDECDKLVSFLLSKMDDKKYIGLDIEWDPVFRKGQSSRTALLQLGIHSGYCVLVRVRQMTCLPPKLEKLLTDQSILKVGVGIKDDVEKILSDFRVFVRGYLDLRSIAPPSSKQNLAALASEHLGVTVAKSKKLRMSKWSRPLSLVQRAYAAKDAYIGALLLPKLVAMKLEIPVDNVSQDDILTVVKTTNELRNQPRKKNEIMKKTNTDKSENCEAPK